jgi:hypothetical protein
MEDCYHVRGLSTIPRNASDTGPDQAGLRAAQGRIAAEGSAIRSYGWA